MRQAGEAKVVENRAHASIPPLVVRAMNLSEQMEYQGSCSVETGRLLRLLTNQFHSGVIGEIAAGCGVGSAWIVSALSPSTSFFTIEADVARAAAARALFDPLLNVRVIHGDWREFFQNWQFSMIFAGASSQRTREPERLFEAMREGSLVVLDGLPPQTRVSLRSRKEADRVREYWLNHPRLHATEVQVSGSEAVILASRIS
jgi:predicted O-methyltransferase YrrM